MAGKETFTQTLPPEEQEIARAIRARYGEMFRTDALLPMAGDGKDGGVMWCEARLNPLTGLWNVDGYETTPGFCVSRDAADPGKLYKKKKRVLADACLIDALYVCAEFQVGREKMSGGFKDDLPGFSGKMHFRAFGTNEGIPFDATTGMPLPAAFGHILTEGTFDDEAESIAAKSAGNVALNEFAGKGSVLRECFAGPATNQTTALVPFQADKTQLAQYVGLNDLAAKAGGLKNAFNSAAYHNFSSFGFGSDLLLIFGVMFTAGILPAVCYARGVSSFPRRCFRVQLKSFRGEVNALPEGPYKAAFGQFADDVELAFHSLDAQHTFQRALGKKSLMRAFTKKQAVLEGVARRQGLPAPEIAALQRQIVNAETGAAFKMSVQHRVSSQAEALSQAVKKPAP